ncbi:MAG: hypothetical protein ABFE13_12125 [Phycisphaerales bacterium]
MTAYATSSEYATYSGSTDVTATATATVVGGEVTALTIGAGGGYGYVSSPAVTIAAPTTGVRATATADVANGVVSLLTLLDGGSGYGVTAPAVTIAPPNDLTRELLRASELIDDFIRTACYEVDDEGDPTDADDIAALRDATCAQVEFWLAGDEEDDVLGPIKELKIGTVDAIPAYVHVLAPRAARILRTAGLYSNSPVVW